MELNQQNLIGYLEQSVPEYKESEQYSLSDKDNVSSVYGGFGTYLADRLEGSSETDLVIQKSFDLLNEMISSEDRDIANVACVEVFEAIAGSKKAIGVAEKLLNKEGLEWLGKTTEWIKAQ